MSGRESNENSGPLLMKIHTFAFPPGVKVVFENFGRKERWVEVFPLENWL